MNTLNLLLSFQDSHRFYNGFFQFVNSKCIQSGLEILWSLHSHDFSKKEQSSQKYLLCIFHYGHLRPSFCSFWGIQSPGLIVSVAAVRAWQFWASGVTELPVDLCVSNEQRSLVRPQLSMTWLSPRKTMLQSFSFGKFNPRNTLSALTSVPYSYFLTPITSKTCLTENCFFEFIIIQIYL